MPELIQFLVNIALVVSFCSMCFFAGTIYGEKKQRNTIEYIQETTEEEPSEIFENSPHANITPVSLTDWRIKNGIY